jgi:hypothetical protein
MHRLLFRLSGYRCFKWYYQRYLCLRSFFPAPVSYNRFVELTGYALLIYTQSFGRGKPARVGFIDSTP